MEDKDSDNKEMGSTITVDDMANATKTIDAVIMTIKTLLTPFRSNIQSAILSSVMTEIHDKEWRASPLSKIGMSGATDEQVDNDQFRKDYHDVLKLEKRLLQQQVGGTEEKELKKVELLCPLCREPLETPNRCRVCGDIGPLADVGEEDA